MPTPPKPVILMTGHISNEEKGIRSAAEQEVLTGERFVEWPEVKRNKIAHKHFKRLSGLYEKIEKNDALIEPVINRYCILQAECAAFEADDKRLRERMEQLDDRRDDMEYPEYLRLALELEKQIERNDGKLQTKRKMLLDIEKETLMTLKAQMASIPKKTADRPVSNKFLRSGTHG